MTAPADDPAVSVCFGVSIDSDDLGVFTSCEGLGIEVVLESREEGGNNGMVWQLPSRLKYPNVKLSRPLTKQTVKVSQWFMNLINGYEPQTAIISAMTADGTIVARWGLFGVVPVRWTGPSLNLDSAKVATETVEIAHHGFLPAGGS
jgi:phage tail-like protein